MRIRNIVVLLILVFVASLFGSLFSFSGMRSGSGNIFNFISNNASQDNFTSQEQNRYATRNDLPSCNGNAVLTQSPAEINTFAFIVPLGNISSSNGVASHVVPTDHMYFQNPPSNTPIVSEAQAITVSETIPVYAPANIKIVEVDAKTYIDSVHNITSNDYSIYFSPCKDVVFYFHHITNINPTILRALDQNTSSQNQCGSTVMDNMTFKACNYFNMNVKLLAGEKIGSGAFDFGMYDYRQKPAAFIDQPKATTLYAACPLDYFIEPIKTQLYKKVTNAKSNVQGLPDCGTNMQDIPNTIQGNWYLPNTLDQNQGGAQNANELSIIHLNIDPSKGVIAWGGSIASPNQLRFQPSSNGIVNREPSQVMIDKQVYCYQGSLGQSDPQHAYQFPNQLIAHILLQLTDEKTLKAEYGQGACPSSPTFLNPTTYVR